MYINTNSYNHIDDVMVDMLTSSVVDHGFEPRLSHTKDYIIDICCFSVKADVMTG